MKHKLPNEDFLAIQQLVGRYQWMVDEGQGEEWADLYTSDGSFSRDGVDPVQGHEALTQIPKWVKANWKGLLRHLSGSLVIEGGPNENEAIARYYNFVTSWTDGVPKMFSFALSELLLVRNDVDWKIKNHHVRELVPPLGIGATK
jgi:hypothetical protein